MAYHKRGDFARLCGKNHRWLANYISRGTVVLSGELVDDSLEINARFLEKWQSKIPADYVPPVLVGKGNRRPPVEKPAKDNSPVKPAKPSKPDVKTATAVKPPVIAPPVRHKIPGPQLEIPYVSPINQLDLKIREIELERKEEDLEIAKLRRAQMAGESMPADLVNSTIAQYSKSVTTAFHNAADNVLIEFQAMVDLSREQVASMRGRLIKIVNQAVDEAYENAAAQVENIVDEYSELRTRGHRK